MSHGDLSDSLRSVSLRTPVVREREVLRIAADIGIGDGESIVTTARNEILSWAQQSTGNLFPQSAWSHQEFEHFAGGRDCSAVRISAENLDIWALRVDVPDKNVAQRVWTTEAFVGRMAHDRARFGLRLLVSSPEKDLQIVPAVPRFIRQLDAVCGLYQGKMKLEPLPWRVESEDDAEKLIELLLDPSRKTPVFIITTVDYVEGGYELLLDPRELAKSLLGIAHVVILPSIFTWALTERFGKRLSVFGGAIRVYLAGFTEDANPYSGHDLILPERIFGADNSLRIASSLSKIAATESIRQIRLAKDVLSFAAVRESSLDINRVRLKDEGATDTEQLLAAQAQIDALKTDFLQAQEDQQWLSDEHKAAEDRAEAAEAQLNAATFRIQQLLAQIKAQGESPDANISLPSSWENFEEWCEQNLVGRVLLTSRACREVRAPQFRDVQLAARCLLWLANDYRERRLSGGEGDLRLSFEPGVENDRSGTDPLQIKWRGRWRDAEWHIKSGGNTRDPARCLRIYYFWDDASQQVVIASMPAHVDTAAT
jgi:hypothetical protein